MMRPAATEAPHMGIWIDTDMGFDDIWAIQMVLHAGLPIDGVSLVFGNTPLAQVEANAAGAARAFNWTLPMHVGRASPVLGRIETAQNVLGETGIPTAGRTLPDAVLAPAAPAFEALAAWLAAPGRHELLALGPLTNLAALALARADLAARIDRLVWMGGGVTSGNHTASAEFNAYADPEALAIVLAAGVPLDMVDLDLCRKVTVRPTDLDPLRRGREPNAALAADLLAGYVAIGTSRGRPGMAIYDPVAALAIVRPDMVGFRPARIEVELAGTLTRGRTVVDTRPSAEANASTAVEIDADAAREMLLAALAAM
jgi:purine nucleosidase